MPPREVKVARIFLSERPVQSALVSPDSLTAVLSRRTAEIEVLKEKPTLHSSQDGHPNGQPPRNGAEPSTIFDDDDTLSLS